jgi:hypothetical protein
MDRHDPLSQLAPAPEAPAPETPPAKGPKRQRKQPLLLKSLAGVTDETLAFLYGGPNQQERDYQRNRERAGEIRRDFAAYCEANMHFADWRQAWAAFMAQRPNEAPVYLAPANRKPVPVQKAAPPLQTPAPLPKWRERLRTAAAIYGP